MSEEYLDWKEPDKEVVIYTAKADAAARILKYLEYSEIEAKGTDSEAEGSVDISVFESEADKAMTYINSFLAQEKKRAYEAAENDESEDDGENIFSKDELEDRDSEVFEVTGQSHAYQTNSQKYDSSVSSAFSFIVVGTLVLVIIALAYLGILKLPITFDDNPLLAIVMPVIAVAFEIIGVISWKNAQKYRDEIGTEQQFDKDVKEWFANNYTAESIDSLCNDNIENVPDELMFLQRIEAIEKVLSNNYPDMDKAYIDVLSEEMYQKLFDKAEE